MKLNSQFTRCRHFAVDIGNSGLRVVEVAAVDGPVAEPHRINWLCSPEGLDPQDESLACGLVPLIPSDRSICWWISSVNRPATKMLTQLLDQHGCEYRLIDYRQLPMLVEVDFPERVGIDRLLAAYAASHYCSDERFVVVQAGSAVTVDLVVREAVESKSTQLKFMGGAILPGVPMMLRLLGRAADMLPELNAKELVNLPVLPGKNTESAMIAGCSSCLVGGVQHLIHRYQSGQGIQQVVISGGDGPLIAPHLTSVVTVVPHLVLQGICKLVRANSN